ncbi:LacI family DNA-binding transcriptional regulator [Arthrobacter sp. B0490]|uniref:LacI family DNA-binding transcriptional regulator n=1 Tax=Arthrobacter sp. B0490 TaxID=2058891 RepID=UPI001C67AB0A|nr:LacI family DNA-binding transcriptional regulator [Arthrobacter sp. B0490]
MAQLAGVSQATVSRVLSSSSKPAPHTIAKVLAAVETLGYVPHAGAQAMKTRRTRTVGVVVDDLINPFYPELLDELTRTLDAAGYRVVIWNAGAESHVDAVAAIRERAVDGVIFTTATKESVELQAAVSQDNPIVLINRIVEGLECDQVASDNVTGGALVADYLLRHGRTRAVLISGTEEASTSRDRCAGFLQRMSDRGHPVPAALQFQGGFSHDRATQIVDGILAGSDRPQAVFCVNDYMAFGALDALRGRTAPGRDDCWVIGYDDVEMAAWESFSLTTVRQPSREMAQAGVRMLLDRLLTPGLPLQQVEFPSVLIPRRSTSYAA